MFISREYENISLEYVLLEKLFSVRNTLWKLFSVAVYENSRENIQL